MIPQSWPGARFRATPTVSNSRKIWAIPSGRMHPPTFLPPPPPPPPPTPSATRPNASIAFCSCPDDNGYMTNSSEPDESPGFIPPHGGYRELKSFQMSELVYDATIKFCDRLIDPKSRTHDQMVQAARSGNKNIAEGSQVSGTSRKMELKLVGVARASLEELLGDYKDFLRQRGLAEWGKNHPMSGVVRRLAYAKNRTYKTYATYIENAPPEVAANTMLCL